jgi:rhodanese-related sulfurtransferase
MDWMLLLLLALLALFLLWDPLWMLFGVRHIWPGALRTRLRQDPRSLYLADLRTGAEYRWFRIPGAHHRQDLLARPDRVANIAPSKDVVLICMTSHRSPPTAWRARKHRRRGRGRVYNLSGGMVGWVLAGGPRESGPPDNSG